MFQGAKPSCLAPSCSDRCSFHCRRRNTGSYQDRKGILLQLIHDLFPPVQPWFSPSFPINTNGLYARRFHHTKAANNLVCSIQSPHLADSALHDCRCSQTTGKFPSPGQEHSARLALPRVFSVRTGASAIIGKDCLMPRQILRWAISSAIV